SLVSFVVVSETPVSMDDADSVRDQPHPRSWNRTRKTRSSILADAARDDRGLRGMEPASRSWNGSHWRLYRWSIVSGIAWGFAIWTSAYESLVLFALVMAVSVFENSKAISARSRRAGWLCFVLVIALALLIERRVPSFSIRYPEPLLQNWARTIGELAHVSPV